MKLSPLLIPLLVVSASLPIVAQEGPVADKLAAKAPLEELSDDQRAKVETLFKKANRLMGEKKATEALPVFRDALKILPKDPSLNFNAGLAAYQTKDYDTAIACWTNLKEVDPLDWHCRAKLVQAYQAAGKLKKRDIEREELFELRSSDKVEGLDRLRRYCRDQFEVDSRLIMVFEEFELKGDHALRYAFVVTDEDGTAEDFRISLGSYKLTNDVWRQLTKPMPKPNERVFHLDGYFRDGSHVT